MRTDLASLFRTGLVACIALAGLTSSAQAVVFPDKNLEAAVRAMVFEKRNNAEELSEDEIVGMTLNIPSLEAREDFRQYMLVGSIFGGEGGREYAEYLAETAWDGEPEVEVKVKRMLAASEANLNRPVPAPPKEEDRG